MSNDVFPDRTYPSRSGSIGDWYTIIRAEMAAVLFSHGIDRAMCMLISRGKSLQWFKLNKQDLKNWCVTRNNLNDAVRKMDKRGVLKVKRNGSHKRHFKISSTVYAREL